MLGYNTSRPMIRQFVSASVHSLVDGGEYLRVVDTDDLLVGSQRLVVARVPEVAHWLVTVPYRLKVAAEILVAIFPRF